MKSRMMATRRKQAEVPVPAPTAAPAPTPAAGPQLVPTPAIPPITPEYESMEEAVHGVTTEVLAGMVKTLVGSKEFANDKAAQFLIDSLMSELKARPVQTEDGAPAKPVPIAASRVASQTCGRCNGTGWMQDKNGLGRHVSCDWCSGSGKTAKTKKADPSSWTAQNEETMEIEEGGSRVPEIAEAHSKLEDHTGIVKSKVVLPEKFAGEISTSTAVSKATSYTDSLKKTYLEAKVLTSVNNSRPVREAVESIFHSSVAMSEAVKVLAKMQVQEDEDEAAAQKKLKDSKTSAQFKLGGLILAESEEKNCDKCGKLVCECKTASTKSAADTDKCTLCGERFATTSTYPLHQDSSGKKCPNSGKKVKGFEIEGSNKRAVQDPMVALRQIAERFEGCDISVEEYKVLRIACEALGWTADRDEYGEVKLTKATKQETPTGSMTDDITDFTFGKDGVLDEVTPEIAEDNAHDSILDRRASAALDKITKLTKKADSSCPGCDGPMTGQDQLCSSCVAME